MRVETIVNITGGELLNNPIINSFNNIKVDTSIIERGDLFFAYNQNDIPKAIKKGAYGVIIDRYIEILDKEIAWINGITTNNFFTPNFINFFFCGQ
jgi:ferrochelatase